MNTYKDIPLWENKRRLDRLAQFRNHIVSYFNGSKYSWQAQARIESSDIQQVRHEIDLRIEEIQRIVREAQVSSRVMWTAAPVDGGYSQPLDILANLFELDRFQIRPNRVVSVLDRAIGVYQDDQRKSANRTFNPLWWIGKILGWLIRLPFRLLGMIGFDADKAESSILGRLTKLILVASSLLAILYYLDLLESVKSWLGITS